MTDTATDALLNQVDILERDMSRLEARRAVMAEAVVDAVADVEYALRPGVAPSLEALLSAFHDLRAVESALEAATAVWMEAVDAL